MVDLQTPVVVGTRLIRATEVIVEEAGQIRLWNQRQRPLRDGADAGCRNLIVREYLTLEAAVPIRGSGRRVIDRKRIICEVAGALRSRWQGYERTYRNTATQF